MYMNAANENMGTCILEEKKSFTTVITDIYADSLELGRVINEIESILFGNIPVNENSATNSPEPTCIYDMLYQSNNNLKYDFSKLLEIIAMLKK